MHEPESGGQIHTSAAASGALVGSALFAMVALGVFGEYVAVGSLAMFLVSAVGGVLGAYAGDHLVQVGRPSREPHPVPPADSETIRAMVEQSDLDSREVATLLLAAERGDDPDDGP